MRGLNNPACRMADWPVCHLGYQDQEERTIHGGEWAKLPCFTWSINKPGMDGSGHARRDTRDVRKWSGNCLLAGLNINQFDLCRLPEN